MNRTETSSGIHAHLIIADKSFAFDQYLTLLLLSPFLFLSPTTTDERNNLLRKKAQQIPHGVPPLREIFIPYPEEDML
jgi:hypothetical protein